MTRIATYLFDSMFQSERKISTTEKILVVVGATLFVASSVLILLI